MCRRVWTSRETTPRHTNLLGFRRYSDASSVSPRGLMTGRTPYKRDARLTTTPNKGPGRTQAPSYLYLSAVSVSNVSQSGLTSTPTALAHHIPLTIACPRASCGAPRTGSRHHPRALDISGGPELPVCTVPLTCARLGDGRPSCKHTVRTSMHTVHTRSCMQQQRTHSLRLGWLPAMRFRLSCLRVLWLLPLLLHACWSTCAGRHAMLLPCRPLNMSSSQGRDARACKW